MTCGLLLLATCRAAGSAFAEAPVAYRLIDHSPVPSTAELRIGPTQRRILGPQQAEISFTLADAPRHAILSFSVGLEAVEQAGTVRFEITLERPSGNQIALYQRDLHAVGWVDERLDLTPYDLSGARLILRKKAVAGFPGLFFRSAWGDPVLLAPEGPPRPSVILISLDTLRADRLGLYGYPAARTPALDGLGTGSVWYDQTSSPSLWTLPSHASMFYGRYLESVPPDALGASRPRALAEIFRDAGYLTAGFTGGGYVSSNFGFNRGFDTYFMFAQTEHRVGACTPDRFDGSEVFARATAWVRERSHAPFFLFIHTYDVHDRCPFRTPELKPWEPWAPLPVDERGKLLAYYDDLIAGVDVKIGALLRELDTLGLAGTTLLVVTSDHGDLFWEHGLCGHGCIVEPYEGVIRIPLMLRYPAVVKNQGRITDPVSLIDLAPTLLALMGLPSPASMEGEVLPGLGPGRPGGSRPLYAACKEHLAVRRGSLKLITTKDAGRRDELYDLKRDPSEADDLASKEPALRDQLRPLAQTFWHTRKPGEEKPRASGDVDEQTQERLRALGYVQ